jgi:hypothetical protein
MKTQAKIAFTIALVCCLLQYTNAAAGWLLDTSHTTCAQACTAQGSSCHSSRRFEITSQDIFNNVLQHAGVSDPSTMCTSYSAVGWRTAPTVWTKTKNCYFMRTSGLINQSDKCTTNPNSGNPNWEQLCCCGTQDSDCPLTAPSTTTTTVTTTTSTTTTTTGSVCLWTTNTFGTYTHNDACALRGCTNGVIIAYKSQNTAPTDAECDDTAETGSQYQPPCNDTPFNANFILALIGCTDS